MEIGIAVAMIWPVLSARYVAIIENRTLASIPKTIARPLNSRALRPGAEGRGTV
jgi:hypothetical protein